MIALYAKRMWLDGLDETIARYAEYGAPTTLERFIPQYFNGWAEAMRAQEKDKMKHRPESEEDITSFKGFGQSEEASSEADEQFWDYVSWVLNDHKE